jgi:uncharacterized protein (DUF885 family)
VTLIAHETRPGHGLQYQTVPQLSSLTRAFFATDAAVEGWAVYTEDTLAKHYDDLQARFGAIQAVLLRVARGFLTPQVLRGERTLEEVQAIYVEDMGFTPSLVRSEWERFAWRDMAQTASYFSGLQGFWKLRDRWKHLSDRQFHDLILRTGPVALSKCEAAMRASVAN